MGKLSAWDCRSMKQLKMWNSDEKKSIDHLLSMDTPDAKKGANMGMLINVLRIALDFLHVIDPEQLFFQQVTDAIAPNYSKVISHPISVSQIQGKMNKNAYKNLELLNEDVKLIHKNCITYNGPFVSVYSKVITDNFIFITLSLCLLLFPRLLIYLFANGDCFTSFFAINSRSYLPLLMRACSRNQLQRKGNLMILRKPNTATRKPNRIPAVSATMNKMNPKLLIHRRLLPHR
jgi:hypothetical protein